MDKYYLIGQTLHAWECYDFVVEEFTNSVRGEAQLRQRVEDLRDDFTEFVVIYGDDISSRFTTKDESPELHPDSPEVQDFKRRNQS